VPTSWERRIDRSAHQSPACLPLRRGRNGVRNRFLTVYLFPRRTPWLDSTAVLRVDDLRDTDFPGSHATRLARLR
jgi:hypothetical protein